MATFSKVLLSGSTQGLPILVVGTNTGTATTIHATGISATTIDAVYLWAVNTDATDRKLTIEFGSNTSPNSLIELSIPAESGPQLIVSGFPLAGSGAAALTVKAFCATANVVTIVGFVNRITA
jgi:hypothetical protein